MMFGKDGAIKRLEERIDELLAEVRKLRQTEAELMGVKDALGSEIEMTRRVQELTAQVATLEEQKQRHDREIAHKLGLHRVQVDAEREAAKKETEAAKRTTELDIREQNLEAEKEAFKKEVELRTELFGEQIKRMESVLEQVMARLPSFEAALKVSVEPGKGKLVGDEG